MSQKRSRQNVSLAQVADANNSTLVSSTPHKRRRQTNEALEALGQLVKNNVIDEADNKLNKNDILSLTLARLLRRKYWPTGIRNKNVDLASNITAPTIHDELNSFIIVLNMSGRIILMSDNAEHYLRKNVSLLYPQTTYIYDCINNNDHEAMRQILSTPTQMEKKIICTWNLPRGKRPSRAHTESKPFLMTGHFMRINDEQLVESQEPLFVARCEPIVSSTPNIPTSTIGVPAPTAIRFVLTDQLNISEISTNTESILGYKAEQLMDQPINRIIPTEYFNVIEQARQNCVFGQHYTTMNVLDLYNNDGERLSFLCNVHVLVEGRRKATKLGFIAQLIDPSIHSECRAFAENQNYEKVKNFSQHETSVVPKVEGCALLTKDVVLSSTETTLNLNRISEVCPAKLIPQRRKRRRLNVDIKIEQIDFNETVHQISQASPELYTNLSDSSSSTASPVQEIGFVNDLISSMEDIYETNDLKQIYGLPSIDDIYNEFGYQDNQKCYLKTPTLDMSFHFNENFF